MYYDAKPHAQLINASCSPSNHHPTSSRTKRYIGVEEVRQRYDMPGIAIAVTRVANDTEREREEEMLSFGHKDHQGNPFDKDVSDTIMPIRQD